MPAIVGRPLDFKSMALGTSSSTLDRRRPPLVFEVIQKALQNRGEYCDGWRRLVYFSNISVRTRAIIIYGGIFCTRYVCGITGSRRAVTRSM